jgi:hypothetical protein
VKAASHSASDLLAALLFGPVRRGKALDRRSLNFAGYVVAITAPGAPRVPNGIESRVTIRPGARGFIGRGKLSIGAVEIEAGEPWDPMPVFDSPVVLPAGPEPVVGSIAPWAGAKDALRAGYIAGLVLLHGQRRRAEQLAVGAMDGAGPIAVTMLRHAQRGEVPEPVHDLLVAHDATRLITWSAAGMAWLRGLISAGLPIDAAAVAARPLAAAFRRPIA